jgi:phosphocarrier protein
MGEDTLEEAVGQGQVEIKNAKGLHMRPAMQFVDVANGFDCDITVSDDKNSANGKSIMEMTMLAATCGTKLQIRAKGEDAAQAIDALTELVEDRMFDKPPRKKRKKKK